MSDESHMNEKKVKDWAKVLSEADAVDLESHELKTEAEETDTISEAQTAEMDVETKHKDEILRLMAQFENYKRLHQSDIEKAHKFAIEKFLNSLLPVVDSIEISLTKLYEAGDIIPKAVIEGLELTLKLFIDTLNRHNVQQINPAGEMFDPHLHEAVTMKPDEAVPHNHVLEVLQKGYTLNNRVIRAALVVVSKNS
jgi:molecular chaperone GrpE